MKFKKVTIQNFMSIGNATIDLDNRGLVLIDGKNMTPASAIDTNGTGKSSMLSAIFYALYGEMPNGDKADSVINKKVGKDTSVELEFSTDSGDYRIVRTRKKTSLKVYSGEEDLTKGTSKETQSLIDSIVGIPKDIYMSTLYFDGHNSMPFSMLTDKQRKEYLEVLFNVGIYHEAYDVTKNDISDKTEQLNSVTNHIKIEESKLAPINNNIEQINTDKETSATRLESMKLDIDSSTSNLESLLSDYNEKKLLVDNRISEIDKTISDISTTDTSHLQQEVNSLSSKLSGNNLKLSSMKATIIEKANLMKSLSVSEVCLVCGNKIDEQHKTNEINKITADIQNLKGPYELLKSKVASDTDVLNERRTKLEEEQRRAEQSNSQLAPLYTEKQTLTSGISELKSQYDSGVQLLNSKKEYYKSELDRSATYDTNLAELNKSVTEINTQIDKLSKDKVNIASSITHLNDALKAFSDKGIKSHVLDLVTPEMNIRANNYLSYLTGGTITAEFSTQTKKANGELSDKFDIKITNNGEETTYNSLSSGEQRRVDISISLTLQDILMSRSNTSSNLLIYDELFESLDAVGSESVVELLKTRLDTADTILVVTHNENLKPLFNTSIVAVKEADGITHVENGVVK